jgi:hypothetical protein
MKYRILILAWAFLATTAGAAGQSGNLVPQGGYCLYAGTWIPVASSTGAAAPESYPQVALYGLNGTTWYPLACDANGNLIPGGAAGGDLSGTYPNPTVIGLEGIALPALAANTGLLYDANGVLSLPSTLPTAEMPALTGDLSGVAGYLSVNVTGLSHVTNAAIPVMVSAPSVMVSAISAGSIVDNTQFSLGSLGIFNPTAMPVTTALANPANLNGLATNNIGQAVAQTAHNSSAIRDCVTTNSSNAYSCLTTPSFTPSAGDTIQANFNALNTGVATLSVNGGSAYPIYKNGGTSLLASGDLQPNHWASLILDSNNHWQIEGQLGQVIATQVNVTTIVDQSNFPLAQLGIFNPAAIPVTTAQPNLANLSGLATNNLGQAIPGIQKYQLKSQYSNATVTPTPIWSFPVNASTNYHVECRGRYKTASGGAFELTLTGPVTPTNIGYTFTPEVNLAANAGTYLDYEVGVATTYPTSINTTAVTAAATDMSFTLIVDLNNSTTAGTLSILGNTISTDTLNVEIGSTCFVIPN